MMRKILIGIGVVAAVGASAWAGTAHYLGKTTEKVIFEQVDLLLKQYPQVAVVERSHQRDLLTSHGRIVFGPDPRCVTETAPGLGEMRIAYRYVVHHGPFKEGAAGVRIQGRLEAEGALKAVMNSLGIDQPLLIERTHVDFGRRARSELESPAWQIRTPDNVRVLWHGMKGRAEGQLSLPATAVVQMDGPGLEVMTEQGRVLVTGLHLNSDLRYTDPRMQFGTIGFEIERMSVMAAGQTAPLFQFSGLRLATDTREQGDGRVEGSFRLGITEGTGPEGFWFKNASYDFDMRNLDAATLIELTERFNKDFGCGDLQGEALQKALLDIGTVGMRLFAHQPEFEIKRIGAQTSAGLFEFSGLVKFNDVKQEDFAAPQALLAKLQAEGKLQMPASMAAQLPLLPELLEAGLVINDKGALKSDWKFAGSALSLNGKPVDPRMFAAAEDPPEPPPAPALRQAPTRRY